MGQGGKLWLRQVGKETLIVGSICLLIWLLFMYEFDYSHKEATLRLVKAALIAVLLNGVFWLMERLWVHWRTR